MCFCPSPFSFKTGLHLTRLYLISLYSTRLHLIALISGLVLATASQNTWAAVRDLRYFLSSHSPHYVLLGEVHDNEQLHRLRLQNLQNANSALEGRTVILAMEQFDVSRQADLDQFAAGLSEADRQNLATTKRLAQAAGFNFEGWSWQYYEPILQLALRRNWRVVAANLSRQEAMGIARGGASALLERINIEWTSQDLARMTQAIQDGHCGLLPEAAVPGMLRAQQARDAHMAETMVRAKGVGANAVVILLAGNTHIRKDWGVPRYLRALDRRAAIFSWGFVETPLGEAVFNNVFDEYIASRPESRPDPCIGLKEHLQKQK